MGEDKGLNEALSYLFRFGFDAHQTLYVITRKLLPIPVPAPNVTLFDFGNAVRL